MNTSADYNRLPIEVILRDAYLTVTGVDYLVLQFIDIVGEPEPSYLTKASTNNMG